MGTEFRKTYSKEFKINAVRMVTEENRKISEVARDLGIHENQVYRWRLKYSEDKEESFPGNGKLKSTDEYIRSLEQENKRLKDERDILKKATIFFAREP
jgi:transposase